MEKCKHILSKTLRIQHGDMIRNVHFHESIHYKDGLLGLSFIDFPYALVLTQDWDLEQEYDLRTAKMISELSDACEENEIYVDKAPISVLLAPIYNYNKLCNGDHLADCLNYLYPSSYYNVETNQIARNKNPEKDMKNNQNPRYHYLSFCDDKILSESLIDFKQYFSVSLMELELLSKTSYICPISPLYREKVSHRFVSFLSRKGLPANRDLTANKPTNCPD